MLPDNHQVPDRARKAAELVEGRTFGVLATLSRRKPGYPFSSIVGYAAGRDGCPLLLLSALAVHTRNLLANPRVSLTVFAAETEADPLAAPRVTLTGEVRAVQEHEYEAARARYTERRPESARYFELGDFSVYRLAVVEAYYVSGFGEMGWVSGPDYAAAR